MNYLDIIILIPFGFAVFNFDLFTCCRNFPFYHGRHGHGASAGRRHRPGCRDDRHITSGVDR
ncbi:MAG TPA: hypothetical protein PLL90_00615, partial [Bacteroidales bacterium]|nr:hypothetical protein [Bacteroidales bacterium]